ncbi:amidase [Alloalcanivorax xenomutans]|jgi:amidase|uniref:amidase n=1 Tax=Alloalcanivorax xenomutans TaxID=1094342 RepID=UPI0003B8BC97|nr:amidase [Alloalcanivorax xenomutans]ERS14796.1 6-aminohexanoate-dimer hydrolase [Alcanivorax sp. PN-3]MBA4722189.1 amidase [Alcanivorax sp.]PHS72546.1 MAG: amidase [Alcanivorax sp.]
MRTAEYAEYDALGLAELIASGQVTQAEVSIAALSAIEQLNPKINALVEVWRSEPRAATGPFKGVPFLVKDLGLTAKGHLNELGSRLAAGCIADEDSNLMVRLRQAGLVTIGRTTTPELAASTTTESVFSGPTRNPWDLSRSAGGSSGGSAAAVAAGLVPAAHATDGGGSIRVPAASTGLFGLKSSRGRISMGPAVDEVWAGLAVHGVVSRTVRDSAALLDAIEGGAVGDPFEIAKPRHSYLSETTREPGSLRIGLLLHPLSNSRSVEPVVNATRNVAIQLQGMGHSVDEVCLDMGVSWESFVEMNARFWSANTTAWIDAIAAETGRPIDAGTLEPATLSLHRMGHQLTATDLLEAMHSRNLVTRSMGHFFCKYDILLSPTLPELPPAIGSYNVGQEHLDGRSWIDRVFSHSPFAALANVTGSPSMSMPLAFDPETGLPIGIQFSAGFGREDMLLRLAGQLERALPWAARKPEVWAGKS